jgi:hypothetical protein
MTVTGGPGLYRGSCRATEAPLSLFAKTPAAAPWQDQRLAQAREREGHVTMVEDRPEWRTGKLCYVEIPAVDVARSAEFYQQPGLAQTEAEAGRHG